MLWPDWVVAGSLNDDAVNTLTSNPDVEYVVEDGIMSAFDIQYVEPPSSVGLYRLSMSTRTDASWNLARMSTRDTLSNQDPFALNYQYKYLPEPGNGIDIYAVDTGAFFLVRSCYGSLNIFFFSFFFRYPHFARTRTFFRQFSVVFTFV